LQIFLDSRFRLLNSGFVPKWAKFIVAILLLPVCVGAAKALWLVLHASSAADTFWVPIVAGAACWIVVFLMLPKPMLFYVFGHELTHAVWTWAFGGRVKKFKASANGGHVIVTKHNFLIGLAPYFFPIYVAMAVTVFALGQVIWNWKRHEVWFHLIIGAAYAFHVTLTWHILKTRQSDITQQGYLFSSVVIFLGNILVLLIGLPLLTRVNFLTAMGWWLRSTGDILERLGQLI
jgi:hypothetical protein